ncbi:MAG: hypothetical protein HY673_08315 [Chloroflexi bacterium]|nr:hypothetical protein [Chloroflexota bacterium]
MSDKFEDILNSCLDRLISRGESLETVLQGHPEHAARLKPLLKTALAVSRAATTASGIELRARGLARFRSAATPAQKPDKKKGMAFPWAWHRPWLTAASIALAVLVAAGGTAFAAAGSMPDQPLYPVKIATEQIQTAVAPSALGKAQLEARLAERRIEELSYIVGKDKPEAVERLSERLYSHYSRIEDLVLGELEDAEKSDVTPVPKAHPKPKRVLRGDGQKLKELKELKRIIRENFPRHEAALKNIEVRAAKGARPAVKKAVERSLNGYKRAVAAADDVEESP